MNAIFLPMFAMGLMGVNRRLYDAGLQYALAQPALKWQAHTTWSAVALGLVQLAFIANLVLTARRTSRDPEKPCGATTREWEGPGPTRRSGSPGTSGPGPIATTAYSVRADTGTSATRLGIWLFLASEAMFFGSLFAGFAPARPTGRAPFGGFPWLETALLAAASLAIGRSRASLLGSTAFAALFVIIKGLNDVALIGKDMTQLDRVCRLEFVQIGILNPNLAHLAEWAISPNDLGFVPRFCGRIAIAS